MILTALLFEHSGTFSGTLPFHPDQRSGPRSMRRLPPMPAVVPMPPTRAAESLGAASVSGRWQWAGAAAPTSPAARESVPQVAAVRVSPLLLDEMRAMATAHGRSLSDIWAEAAREWLRRHAHEDEPQPPTPAAAALAVPLPARSWAAIDTVLADLRRSPDSAA